MHLIQIVSRAYDEDGRFYGCVLGLTPIFSNNSAANMALYTEMWHRLRRHRYCLCERAGIPLDFDASFYFKSPSTATDGMIPAAIMVNGAETHSISLNHSTTQSSAIQTIRRMDTLLYEFIFGRSNHDLAMESIAAKYAAGLTKEADADLKELFKVYCRSQGLFINLDDVAHANAQARERRRQAYIARHAQD